MRNLAFFVPTFVLSFFSSAMAAPPKEVVAGEETETPPRGAEGIQWHHDFSLALQLAKEKDRPLLVDFEAEWCGWCKKLDRETYADERVVRLVREHFVAAKVDTDKQPDLAKKYEVSGLPTILVLSPLAAELERFTGFRPAERFLDELGKSARSAASLAKLREAAEEAPADPAAQRAYARALFAAGSHDEAVARLEKALKEHPNDAGLLLDLADGRFARRDMKQARQLYERLLALPGEEAADEQSRAYLPLGRTLVSLEEHGEAVRVLGAYLEARSKAGPADLEKPDPRLLEALFLRGYAHAVLKDAPRAIEDLKAATNLDPTGEWGLRAAGILDLVQAE